MPRWLKYASCALLVALGTALLLWYGARMVVVQGAMTGEEFIGFIVLSTNSFLPIDAQEQFVQADLQDQEAAGYPGPIFVALHAAGVSTGSRGGAATTR